MSHKPEALISSALGSCTPISGTTSSTLYTKAGRRLALRGNSITPKQEKARERSISQGGRA